MTLRFPYQGRYFKAHVRPPSAPGLGLGLSALLFLGGCATRAPLIVHGPAGPASLSCAASMLSGEDYRVDQTTAAITGEARVMSGDIGVAREFITVAVGDAHMMTTTVEAFRLDEAAHDLPVQRQSATPTRPSDDAIQLAHRIDGECGG
ncbi:MAG: hypothetical protein ACR2QM_03705 [Longimicrobiales bacterium]